MSSSATTSPYKPSPLSYNSPRTSPFRRPESPFTRSPSTIRASTSFATAPIEQPRSNHIRSDSNDNNNDRSDTFKNGNSTLNSPPPRYNQQRPGSSSSSYFGNSSIKDLTIADNSNNNNNGDVATPAPLSTGNNKSSRPLPAAPTTTKATTNLSSSSSSSTSLPPTMAPNNGASNASIPSDPLSRLAPQHLLPMREAFSILDRSNTGTVTRADITDMLRQLGMDSSDRSVDAFFNHNRHLSDGAGRTSNNTSEKGITLPAFLATLSAVLPDPATAPELTAAFAAFDDADAGQADWAELREALVKEASGSGNDRAGNGGGSAISTSEIDAVMDMFRGRRAFGNGGISGRSKGYPAVTASKNDAVFKYHDFVAAVTGGNGNGNGNGNSSSTARTRA